MQDEMNDIQYTRPEDPDIVKVVRCKDCRHFELNHFEKVNGIPLILAHEICIFWAGGVKTSADGYCSYGERKDG